MLLKCTYYLSCLYIFEWILLFSDPEPSAVGRALWHDRRRAAAEARAGPQGPRRLRPARGGREAGALNRPQQQRPSGGPLLPASCPCASCSYWCWCCSYGGDLSSHYPAVRIFCCCSASAAPTGGPQHCDGDGVRDDASTTPATAALRSTCHSRYPRGIRWRHAPSPPSCIIPRWCS